MANWPYLRHDRGRTSLSENPADIGSLIWQFTPGVDIYICAPPVISPSGFIYVLAEGFGDGFYHLYRLDPADGSVVWQATGSRLSSAPQEPTCLSDDAVMIGVREHVYCFEPGAGTMRWDFNPASGGGGNLPIELDSGDLAVIFQNFGPSAQLLNTIKASDASTVTTATISPVANAVAMSTDGTDVFIQQTVAGATKLRRYTATTGAIAWTASLTSGILFPNGPAVRVGNYVLVQAYHGPLQTNLFLYCVDYATGTLNWTAPSAWGGGFYGRDIGLAPATDGTFVYHQLAEIDNGDGTFTETLEALDITDGSSVWTQTAVAQDQNDNRSAVPSIGSDGNLYWDIDGVQLIRTSDGAIIGNVPRSTLWGTNPDTTHNIFIHNPSIGNGYFLQDGGGTGQSTFGLGTRPSIFCFATVTPPVVITQFGRASEAQTNFGAVPSTASNTVVIPFAGS